MEHLFLADAKAIPAEPRPAEGHKGASPIKLATLENIVAGTECKKAYNLMRRVHSFGDAGPWVIRLNEPLVRGLAEVSDARVRDVAMRWMATSEWWLEGEGEADLPEVEDMIRGWTVLARRAIAECKEVHLWWEL